jgi:hypothetical protein
MARQAKIREGLKWGLRFARAGRQIILCDQIWGRPYEKW